MGTLDVLAFPRPLSLRPGLNLQTNRKISHAAILLLLAGDIATNPGPTFKTVNQSQEKSFKKTPLKCLLLNARSLKSQHKQGMKVTNNIHNFQDLDYSENSEIVCVNETWLNKDILNCEILGPDYEIFRKDRESRGGGGGGSVNDH